MKRALILSLCLLALLVGVKAQLPETFDLATFQPPKGWKKQASRESVQFSTEDKASGAYCLITLLRSLPGPSNSTENFDSAWQLHVKGAVNPAGAPQMFPSNNPEDWALEGGFAPFEKGGEKGVVLLYTSSGYGKMVNVMILTNTQAYESNITAFVESISLKNRSQKLAPPSPPFPPNNRDVHCVEWLRLCNHQIRRRMDKRGSGRLGAGDERSWKSIDSLSQ